MFVNRGDAGRQLGRKLLRLASRDDVIVLALPRGGVPVGYEVARLLRVPLDVFLVRKLGTPGREELAMGAIASGGVRVMNTDVVRDLGITPGEIAEAVTREAEELRRREEAYRDDRPVPDLRGKTVILVDDGLATGSTMRAAVAAVRKLGPARVVVAVPVGAAETCRDFRSVADDVVCVDTPDPFFAVGNCYQDFSQTTDDEVRVLLARSSGMGSPVG